MNRNPLQLGRFRALVLTSSLAAFGCGDDSGGHDTDAGTGTDTEPGTTGTTAPTTTPMTDTAETTTGETTQPTTQTGTTTGDTMTGTGTATEGDTDAPGTDTGGFDCSTIPAGPFAATPVFDEFEWDGSEDLAFDGAGQIVALRGSELVAVDDAATETVVATGIPGLYGLRYRPSGTLLGAAFQQGRIIEVDDQGNVGDLVTNQGGVNGIYVDFDDVVWFTNFQSVQRVEGEDVTQIASGPDGAGANGVIYDANRGVLFFTGYTTGTIRRVAIDDQGAPGGPVQTIATIAGTSPDGLALDVCGNLYVVDQQGNMIYRLFLDENAEPIGDAEPLLDAATDLNIANAQFGTGIGFDDTTLYALGVPGVLYEIPVGVPGEPYSTP